MEHIKHYKNIKVSPYEFIRKAINYANSTSEEKSIKVVSSSNFIKIKKSKILIKPYSSGLIQLRMHFD